jgi:tetratricopeptide (TPR) repeat protein
LANLAEEHPHSPLVQREWGRRLLDAGAHQEACRALVRVARLEPHSVAAQLEALVAFLAAGQWEMAEMYAVRALRMEPKHAEANLWMARLQSRLEPLAASQYAEQFLQGVDSSHPAWAEAWELLDNGLPVEIREAMR